MNFLITGASGFIGVRLTARLTQQGHHVYAVSRSPKKHKDTENITYVSYDVRPEELPKIHGVVNLAGESLFGYWTEGKKKEIRKSRIEATQKIVALIKQLNPKPEVFINGSAVGFYGTSNELIFTENTVKPGDDFLSSVVVDWEETAMELEDAEVRTVFSRMGIVLGEIDGVLPIMELPVRLFAGGKIGDGEQWISWIHIGDAVRLLEHCLFNQSISGPVNFTAPGPKRNKDFYLELARTLKRPYWLPVPAFFIRLVLGEMADLVAKGQYVYPKKALNHGFTYNYPTLAEALEDLR
jgi:hypothetical protein